MSFPRLRRIYTKRLGISGSAMSANLLKAGFEVFAFDPDTAARLRLKKVGGTPCTSRADVTSRVAVLIASLPSTQAMIDEFQPNHSPGRRQAPTGTTAGVTRLPLPQPIRHLHARRNSLQPRR